MRALTNPKHDRDIRPVHVGVEQTNTCTREAQRYRDVDRNRRLAHTALPGADGDGIANPGDLLASGQPSRGAHVGVPADLDPGDAGDDAQDRGIDVIANPIFQRAGRRCEHDPDRGDPAVDREVTQHPELEHRLVQLGIDDSGESPLEGVERSGITHLALSIPTALQAKLRQVER